MRTFLLSWNPTQWAWDYLHDSIAQVFQQGYSDDHWSCGNRRDIDIGDRFFLIRLGSDPRGIVASGFVTSKAYDGPHWDSQRAVNGDTSIYVKVRFDSIHEIPVIPMSELHGAPFNSVHWHTQSSGISIPPNIADAVEQVWASRSSTNPIRLPEELAACPVYIEGVGRNIVVNAYERSAAARKACLDHHGCKCLCCDTSLADVYGQVASNFVHVHHIKPLSEIGQSYVVDPVNDLVPVCPNCHAVMHLENPPLTISKVKELLATHSRSRR